MLKKVEKRLASVMDKIEWREQELTGVLRDFAEETARYAAMCEDARQIKMAAVYASEHTRSTVERIRGLREELDKLYEEKAMLEWIKEGS